MLNYDPLGGFIPKNSLSSEQTYTIPPEANGVLAQAFTKAVWYTVDGSTPSSGNRFAIAADADPVLLPFPPGTVLTFIEAEASATLTLLPVLAYTQRKWAL